MEHFITRNNIFLRFLLEICNDQISANLDVCGCVYSGSLIFCIISLFLGTFIEEKWKKRNSVGLPSGSGLHFMGHIQLRRHGNLHGTSKIVVLTTTMLHFPAM